MFCFPIIERIAQLGAGNCLAERPLSNTTVCRTAKSNCDAAEFCDGQSLGCPTDVFQSNYTVCRPSVDSCDTAELCDGKGKCPPDRRLSDGTVCRPSAGICGNVLMRWFEFPTRFEFPNRVCFFALGIRRFARRLCQWHMHSRFRCSVVGQFRLSPSKECTFVV